MKAITTWFIDNPVAANLLMVLILVGGLSSFSSVNKQFFPTNKINTIDISVVYPGAGPVEVEQQILLRLEEAVDDVPGVVEINSFAREGVAEMQLEVDLQESLSDVVNKVKARVDAINTFPQEIERPVVAETLGETRMISLALYGDVSEADLKQIAYRLRDQMSALPDVGTVKIGGVRNDEVSIEVSENTLRQYGLRFDEVATAVRNSSLNLPAGKIRSNQGDMQLQTRAQSYTADDFADIVLLRDNDGTQLRLGEVASIEDGFEELDVLSRFNQSPALSLDVFVANDPDVIKTSEQVYAFVEKARQTLPAAVQLTIWKDMSVAYRDRIGTLLANGLGGLLLVFTVLVLFLRPLLAIWVCVGIAVAFLGALWMLPLSGSTLNMVSLFAFILILGIVVDDAIIVGESIFTRQQNGEEAIAGAKRGTHAVIKPVVFAVVSTMVFFSIMFYLPGTNGSPVAIAVVVLAALSFSLVESLLILPSHLAHMKPERPSRFTSLRYLQQRRERLVNGLMYVANHIYRPMLARCMVHRQMTLVVFLVAFFVALALLIGGWIQTSFFPRVPSDFLKANIVMAEGAPFQQVNTVARRVEFAAQSVRDQYNEQYDFPVIGHIEVQARENEINAQLEMENVTRANISPVEIRQAWSQAIWPVVGAEEFDVNFTVIRLGKPIELLVSSVDVDELRALSAELSKELQKYPGVYNVRDGLESPVTELQLRLKPQAESLELTLADVARQVRRGFYGEEVQRIPRLREDVKVMVRYPSSERVSETFLRDMRIRTQDGLEVPFESVAELVYVDGYTEIQRQNRQRVSRVTADLDATETSARAVIASLLRSKSAQWQQQFPSVSIKTAGEQKEFGEFVYTMVTLLLTAVIIIYGLIAVAFRSYWQPLLVLAAIPFALTGAIIGHLVMQVGITMFSLMGVIAAAGVVVNDNLVLIDRVNYLRRKNLSLQNALLEGAKDRFRPVILTSITTLIGLMPIMLEQSVQAKFLVPMVVSLAFGVLLAMFVSLIFVPVLYLSLQQRVDRIRGGYKRLRLQAVGS